MYIYIYMYIHIYACKCVGNCKVYCRAQQPFPTWELLHWCWVMWRPTSLQRSSEITNFFQGYFIINNYAMTQQGWINWNFRCGSTSCGLLMRSLGATGCPQASGRWPLVSWLISKRPPCQLPSWIITWKSCLEPKKHFLLTNLRQEGSQSRQSQEDSRKVPSTKELSGLKWLINRRFTTCVHKQQARARASAHVFANLRRFQTWKFRLASFPGEGSSGGRGSHGRTERRWDPDQLTSV